MLKGSTVRGDLSLQREINPNYGIRRYNNSHKLAINKIDPNVSVYMHDVVYRISVYDIHSKHVLNSNKPIRLDAKAQYLRTIKHKCAIDKNSRKRYLQIKRGLRK